MNMVVYIALFFPAAVMVILKRLLSKEKSGLWKLLLNYVGYVVLINLVVVVVVRFMMGNRGNLISDMHAYPGFALKYISLSMALAIGIPLMQAFRAMLHEGKIDWRKARRGYGILLTVILAVVILTFTYIRLKENDVFDKTDEEAGYMDLTNALDDDVASADYVLYAEGFPQTYFYPGTYKITVQADSNVEDAYFQVVDLWTNTVLAEYAYAPGENYNKTTFTTMGCYEYVVVRSYVASGEVLSALAAEGEISELLTISSYHMVSDGAVCTDGEWTIVLFLLFLLLVGFGIYRAARMKKSALLSLTVMAGIVSLPFMNDYLPRGHDLEFHMARIFSLGQSFMEGQIPQHLNVSMFTAEITSILYPELVLYPAGILCAAGTTVWFACQFTYVLITFLTAFIAYYAARQMSGQRTALLFACLYLINPYRLNDIFVRAAIGEAFAMVFLPLIAVGMWKALRGEKKEERIKGATDLILGFTGMLSAHIIMSLLSVWQCVVMIVILFLMHPERFIRDIGRLKGILAAAGITVLLNLWFLLPFFKFYGVETKLTVNNSYALMEASAPYLWQFFMGVTGSGNLYDTDSAAGEMPLTVGFSLLIGIVLFLWMNLSDHVNKKSKEDVSIAEDGISLKRSVAYLGSYEKQIGALSLLVALTFLYMSTSYFPWEWVCETFPFVASSLGMIQYPWRLLTVVALMLTVVLVIVLRALLRREDRHFWLAGGMILVLCVLSAVSAGTYYFLNDVFLSDKFSTPSPSTINADYVLSVADEKEMKKWYLSGEGPQILAEADDTVAYEESSEALEASGAQESLEIVAYYRDGTDYVFTYENSSDQAVTVTAPVLWYGLHTAILQDDEGGEEQVLDAAMNETLQFTDVVLPANSAGTVSIQYVKPLLWSIADGISLAAWIACIAGLLYSRKRRRASVSAEN